MKNIKMGGIIPASAVSLGCMRMSGLSEERVDAIMKCAFEHGINHFDHADIYGGGNSEVLFGQYLKRHPEARDKMVLQTKCGIRPGQYDFSKEHIVSAVEGSLSRLGVDYVDALLLHRPDTLMEPEEVAEAFDELYTKGKVRYFGVSNHKPMQIELLKRYVKQPLHINQLQFSMTVSNMVANGLEVNMTSDGAPDYDGSILDYSRLHDMTIQAWSPFQMPNWQGCFIDCDKYPKLNEEMKALAEQYGVSKNTIATAWILRHPAKMQVVTGTASEARLAEIMAAEKVDLTRQEWYHLYLAAGHILP